MLLSTWYIFNLSFFPSCQDDREETQPQYNEIEPEERSSLVSELGDRYDIQNIIGKGACGVVYKGFDRENAREVALKRMQYCDVDANGIPPHVLREVTALRSLMNVDANINIIRSSQFPFV